MDEEINILNSKLIEESNSSQLNEKIAQLTRKNTQLLNEIEILKL
jgi:hypothetical protein